MGACVWTTPPARKCRYTPRCRASSEPPEPVLPLRHPPTQARSRERLRLVMDVADELLAREGAESFTTTRIAEAARVPVGSVYRFFDDKEAIVEALAVRYWRDFDDLVAGIAEADEREPLADPAGTVLDALAAGFRARPGFLALWYGGLRTERVRDLALIPAPGCPALPHLVGSSIYEGTYDNPSGSSLPSRVLQYSDGGELLDSWTVAGQDTSKPHGVQVAANDVRGRLLLLDKTSGRIIRLDPRTGSQMLYARVPDLPTCSNASPGA